MLIKIFGNTPESQKLYDITQESLETLGLSDFVVVERTDDENYKKELNITSDPAFCVEEDSIEFRDVIFE
jgi:hypothetical protein